jgi:hypothetical protein
MEIALGIGVGLVLFLFWQGVNVLPVLFFAGLVLLLLFSGNLRTVNHTSDISVYDGIYIALFRIINIFMRTVLSGIIYPEINFTPLFGRFIP